MEIHLTDAQEKTLFRVAEASIAEGLARGRPRAVDPRTFDPALQARRATFVTLNRKGQLRGCIGHLEAIQPLVQDVAENAFAAAFRDPRFPPLTEGEFPELQIEISVLSVPAPLACSSESELLQKLEPGIDGLILEADGARATFLPSVWKSLPDPREFLRHLKRKAGLPERYWSDHLRIYRYRTTVLAKSCEGP